MVGPEAVIGKGMLGKNPKNLAVAAGGGAIIGTFSAIKPWVILAPNEVAVKTRFGKTVRSGWLAKLFRKDGVPYGTVTKPGFSLVPSVSAKVLSAGYHADVIEKFNVDTNKNTQIEVSAGFTWRISPKNARITYEKISRDGADIMQLANSMGSSALRAVMDGKTKTEMKNNPFIQAKCIQFAKPQMDEFGLEIGQIFIKGASDSAPQRIGGLLVQAHTGMMPEEAGNSSYVDEAIAAVAVGVGEQGAEMLAFGRPSEAESIALDN